MKRFSQEGIEWLQFDHLSECKKLKHGVFLRHGGVSGEEYGSLNLGLSSGDDVEKVSINRQKVSSLMGIQQMVHAYQMHGKSAVSAQACLNTSLEADILHTNVVDHAGLFIMHADCQAAIFYDPILHVVANVHCGWRGNVCNIYQETVDLLRQQYGCDPSNLLVGISPSLGPEAAQFIHYEKELPREFWRFQVKPLYFNLWEVSRWQLIQAGVLDHHIEIAGICTYQNPHDYFSYRRFKQSGRHATVATLL